MQYTLRNVPRKVDQALRARARAERKSLNETTVEVLKTALGISDEPAKKRDLSDLVGSLSDSDAKAINDAVAFMDRADLKLRRGGRA
jgi:plasmid stability protein